MVMGRQRKVGLDYFPLDIDFFDDEKIIAISGEFGIKGEITVIKLLCAIYRNGYFILWNNLLKYKLAKSCPGVSAELIESIVNRLVLWEFFDKALFDSVKVLTSRGIQRRYFEATKRRLKEGEEPLPYLLKNIYVDINRINVDINRISVDRKYTKESKVNKNKYIYAFPLKDGTTYEVNENDILLWERTYKNINVRDELLCIISWVDSNPSKRKTRAGAKKFINGWLNKNNSERKPKEVKQHEYPRL